MNLLGEQLPLLVRLLGIVVLTGIAQLVVVLIRRVSDRLTRTQTHRSRSALRKLRSVISLTTSALVFTIYFVAFGLILREFGVSLTAYLASASIIGLAVGFGSQGVVQDVVTGLTLLFSDLLDVGSMVEISGKSGRVKSIGMRFIELEDSYGARIFIPNRTVANVINYPKGYVRCIVDVTLSEDDEIAGKMIDAITEMTQNVAEQFPGILLAPPSIEGRMSTKSGKEFLRIKFRVWPGRGDPIEKTFRQELVQALQTLESTFKDWQVAVYYEVEKK